MLSAFKIRQEVGKAETADGSGISRARRLLRIARCIRRDARKLVAVSYRLFLEGQRAQAARFLSANKRLMDLHDEVRARARQALGSSSAHRRESPLFDKEAPCHDPIAAAPVEAPAMHGGAL